MRSTATTLYRCSSNATVGADDLLNAAIANGGRRLDAFDTVLPELYSKRGFRVTGRVPFNNEFAPKGWDYDLYGKYNNGRPDIVFMVHDPPGAHPYVPGEGRVFSSYDEADAFNRAEALRLR
jgi:hypothetical protein